MKFQFSRILFVFLLLFAISSPAIAQDLMTWQEVDRLIDASPNKEVKAYFESVERGSKKERYDITLRGVYQEPGFRVITFVTHRRIVGGMSGSPTYIDGKLIGAMAYSFNNFSFSDWHWGGIQPINSMIEQAEPGHGRTDGARTFNYQGMTFEPILMGNQTIPGLESLGKFIVSNNAAGQIISANAKNLVLEPGMPIVVDLVEWTDEKGELNTISAMGTVTYIDKKGRIYAFGHPFMDSRNVVYSFRTAEVMGTIYSEDSSNKLTGKVSDVLGTITFDGSHGISGSISKDNLNQLHNFDLKFQSEGKTFHDFKIKVADSVITPLLAQVAFKMIGAQYGAPLPQEVSVTQIESRIELDGNQPILWKELFTSDSIRFGTQTIFISSYTVAYEAFFANVYNRLFVNDYDLNISNVKVSVNFLPGKSRVYKMGRFKFPSKVIYGQDPVLEIMFVDQGNSMPIAKKIPVKIDWSMVEKPVYTKDTMDTDKVSEKVISGTLNISSSFRFYLLVSQNGGAERQTFSPTYFLGADDFLENFNRLLRATNQKIFVRVALKSRSGLFEERIAKVDDIIPEDVTENGNSDWYVIKGGLKTRKTTLKDEGSVVFYPELPSVPDGYIIDQNMNDGLAFEIVLEK